MSDKNVETKKSEVRYKRSIAAILAAVLALFCLGALVYVIKINVEQNKKTNKFISNQVKRQLEEDEKENAYVEDGFKVGDQYEIRSTKAVSDAYLSGDASKLSDADKKLYDVAVKIFEKETKGKATVYDKEKAIYEWIYKNIKTSSGSTGPSFNEDADTFTPLGVLTGKKAVCVGYATTFRLFMQMLGLDVHIAHNDYHSWDLVQLDDGEWYYTDIYTDVSSGSKYLYFNVTESFIKNNSDFDSSALPYADGVKYSLANQESVELKDYYELPKAIKKSVKKKSVIDYYTFKKKVTEKDAPVIEAIVSNITSALIEIGEKDFADGNVSLSTYWYKGENDKPILAVVYQRYNTDDSEQLDSKTLKKIEDAINKTFKSSITVSNGDEPISDDSGNADMYSYDEQTGETTKVSNNIAA